jgi:hypothetical protein
MEQVVPKEKPEKVRRNSHPSQKIMESSILFRAHADPVAMLFY